MFGITFRKETEEKRWLRKALDGDNTATEWIYRKHVRYLSALCSRYITEDEDIRDVLQESFIKIFTSLDRFRYRGEGSLKAWMAKITLNETLKFVRNNSRLPIDSIDDKDMNIADGDSMETEDIPTDVLHQFIRELPDGYRTVFNLYVIDDKSHKEIAQLLGIKENTSASQLHKAKSMLAQKIKHYRTINSI
ncbi:sigma-70 family RNA polymerase sigma factor [uncultured Prevotella sp.]|jgi:RNA polymerase sigma factor (sigma-70 family)|uniref:RNA polymerase sigma factor n=1 Tax=uncultured Prevotella sp. TaxID=159272 RepID=UPI00258E2E4A|nr:sigma-70 family RNA polymerase sigma factor [uncultured Prevotella sp.]